MKLTAHAMLVGVAILAQGCCTSAVRDLCSETLPPPHSISRAVQTSRAVYIEYETRGDPSVCHAHTLFDEPYSGIAQFSGHPIPAGVVRGSKVLHIVNLEDNGEVPREKRAVIETSGDRAPRGRAGDPWRRLSQIEITEVPKVAYYKEEDNLTAYIARRSADGRVLVTQSDLRGKWTPPGRKFALVALTPFAFALDVVTFPVQVLVMQFVL